MRGFGGIRRWYRMVLYGLLAFFLTSFGWAICLKMSEGFGGWMFPYEEATNGVYDTSKAKMPDKAGTFSGLYLTGQWEFFYNRWIETDQDREPADGYLRIGKSWADGLSNGKSFPKEGYASYRLTLINLTPNYAFKVEEVPFFDACQFFLNGTFCGAYGFPGKDEASSKIAGRFRDSKIVTAPQDGKLVLVMELGYNRVGGMGNRPDLDLAATPEDSALHLSNPSVVFFYILPLIGLVILSVITAISGAILVMGRGRKFDSSFFDFFLSMVLAFFFSYDGYILMEMLFASPWKRAFDMGFIFALIPISESFLAMLNHLGATPFHDKKSQRIAYLSLGLVELALTLSAVLTLGKVASVYCWGAALSVLVPLLYFGIRSCGRGVKGSVAPLVLLSLTLDLEIVEFLDIEEYLEWKTLNVPSIAIVTIAIVAFIVFVRRTRLILKEEADKEDKAKRYENAKQEALRGQIKPHFVFNCLSAIEGTYHRSQEEGDHAMALFAAHLRSDVDSMEKNLIPFEEEIANVNHYLELENLRLEKKFTLLFDINDIDFQVPPLSLQPLIENAIKYSKVNEKPDGWIGLSSDRNDDGSITLTVEDNGVGFDETKTTSDSQGLKNVRERFALILGATMSIRSIPEEGTRVVILIPAPARTPIEKRSQ